MPRGRAPRNRPPDAPDAATPANPDTAPSPPTPGMTISEGARLSVLDRRLKHPFGTPSRGIPLADRRKACVLRFFTADQEHPDRHYVAIHEKGWQPCRPEDLAVPPESIGLSLNAGGFVVRGIRGQDLLMWMPQEDFDALVEAKTQANLARLKPQATRAEVAQATAKEYGDAAGESVYRGFEQRSIVGPILPEE